MANVKISELPVATSVDVVDTVPLVQGGTTKQATQTTLLTTTGNVTAAKLVPTGGTATGNGMYLPATNALAWSTNGVEGMRLDASGNLGIGTSTPSKKLTVEIANTFDGTRVISNAASTDPGAAAVFEGIGARNDGNQTFFTRFAAAYRRSDGAAIPVDAGLGAVLFGGQWGTDTTYQSAKVLYPASIVGIAEGSFTSAFAMPTGISFRTGSTGDNLYAPNLSYGIERARITSGGDLLVGTASTAGRICSDVGSSTTLNAYDGLTPNSYAGIVYQSRSLTAAGNGWYHFVGQSGNGSSITTNNILIFGNGDVQNTNNSYGAISDRKLKENITDASPKLNDLLQVRIVNYNFKTQPDQRCIGVIAQELEQVFPGMVSETPDRDADGNDLGTTTKAVKYSVFVPMLIKAIQEQQAIINDLRARVAALEA